jgi:hypothetical protein
MHDLEKTNEEIRTCLGMMEMERDRLQQELDTLKGNTSA